MNADSWQRETQVVAAGRPARVENAPANPAVVLSSTYLGTSEPQPGDRVYARWGTETWEPLEEALATLEQADRPGIVFASGMAAVTAALDLLAPGGHLILPSHGYHATGLVAAELSRSAGVQVNSVPIAQTEAVVQSITDASAAGLPATDTAGRRGLVVWIESPTNPSLEIADIPALVRATHDAGGLVVVDNTFATPLGQRPLAAGADVVVHSVTKAISGHSDVLLGAVLTSDPQLHATLRTRRTLTGGIAGQWEAWLALRGLRTLALRLERASANAAELARRLEGHEHVVEVSYPGLASHPQHERAAAQLDTFGSILTLRPRGGKAGAQAVVESVSLWLPATSLGGVESSLERRRRFGSEASDIPEDLLRVSVGIEDVEDLADDLFAALAVAAATAAG